MFFLRVAWSSSSQELSISQDSFQNQISVQNELKSYQMLQFKLQQILKTHPQVPHLSFLPHAALVSLLVWFWDGSTVALHDTCCRLSSFPSSSGIFC